MHVDYVSIDCRGKKVEKILKVLNGIRRLTYEKMGLL